MASISVPLEFWFNRITGLAIPLYNIHFNHPIKSILWSLNINNNSKKYKEEQDINFICNKLKKICIPTTYEEWCIKEEKEWLYNFMNIDIDE